MANAPRDDNHEPALLGTSTADPEVAVPIGADPSTNELLVKPALSSYLTEIARGNVVGQSIYSMVGRNPNMQAGQLETLWDQGGLYTYLTADTQLYASSTSASDTSVLIAVFGLDDNYAEVTRFVTLNGQTQVALDDLMFRVHSALVAGATEPLGDVYIAETDTLTGGVPDTTSKIKAKIIQGFNATQMALFTVPAGKTAYAEGQLLSVGKGSSLKIRPLLKPFGGVFIAGSEYEVYQETVQNIRLPGIQAAEKYDIEYRGIADNNGTIALAALDAIFIDN